MKRKRFLKPLTALAALTLALFMLASCGQKYSDAKYSEAAPSEAKDYSGTDIEDISSAVGENGGKTGEKIIEYLTLDVQTTAFDELVESVQKKVSELGGYIEKSNVDGSSYNQLNDSRRAYFTLRVPTGKKDDIVGSIGENSTIVNKETTTENVTLIYVDLESRVSALNAEKEALEGLLAKAESTSDIIIIQNQLTDVIYKIESYRSRLRTYDNLVEYMTVTLNIYEVERVDITEKQTVFQRIGNQLSDNFRSVGDGLVEAFVWFVSAIPFFIVIAVIAVIVILIVKAQHKAERKRREKRAANNATGQNGVSAGDNEQIK